MEAVGDVQYIEGLSLGRRRRGGRERELCDERCWCSERVVIATQPPAAAGFISPLFTRHLL